jgi:hypothetical protein
LILKLALLHHSQWLVGVAMAGVPVAGPPDAITVSHRSIAQGQMPPLVDHRHRPGESLLYADARLGFFVMTPDFAH